MWNWDTPRRVRVHGFDLNDTLIRTPSGKFPPVSADDYEWLPGRRERLVGILGAHSRNCVWILTNQGWRADGALAVAVEIAERCRREVIEAYREEYEDDPTERCRLTIASKHTPTWRKPYPHAWSALRDELVAFRRQAVPELLYYCGDDVERTGADLLFALNARTRFLAAGDYATPDSAIDPEEHPMVVRTREKLASSGGDPKEWRRAVKKVAKSVRPNSLIILSGLQGSGKSTFARALVEANPELTIYDEFTKSLVGAIHQGGYPAVFDRTHLSRKNIDEVVKKMKTLVGTPKVLTIFVSATPEVCARNIWARTEQKVPMVALRCGLKKLKENRAELHEDLVVTPPVDPSGLLGPCWKDLKPEVP